MNILSFTGIALVMCVMILTVGQLKPELSLLLTIACGVTLTLFLIGFARPLIDGIGAIASAGGVDGELLTVVLKAFGICIAVQTALAGRLELGGRLALLLVALPLFRRLLDLAGEIIGK